MKHVTLDEMQSLEGGYCIQVGDLCINPQCTIANIYNSVAVSVTITVNGQTFSYEKDGMVCLR